MSFDITNFKNRLTGGGARPSLFEVTLSIPLAFIVDPALAAGPFNPADAVRDIPFMCKSAGIPASTVAAIEVPYFGRKVKYAGNRTFPEWTITIINDENFNIRKMFENWLAGINTHETNVRTFTETASAVGTGVGALGGYQTSARVKQYGKRGQSVVLREYEFVNLFPTEISPIELNWGSENEIEEYTVTLQYDFWRTKA